MKHFTFLAIVLFYFGMAHSQRISADVTISQERDELNNFTILHPTENLLIKAKDLPAIYDNSDSPALRPVFMQNGWSCGQASTIGYTFTYELNSLRNISSDTSINQYSPMFTYNFLNDGSASNGVNFKISSEIIKKSGVPTGLEFNESENGALGWMDGYENYYSAMKNRIADVFAFNIGDEEGLLMLKSWLFDHFETQEFGGLANIYFDLPSSQALPPGTPEEGKRVLVDIPPGYGHAITFVGWNDSIRWDYNDDGQYTNDIDINDDGVVNMRDWEIGGLRFINSHGVNYADSGFCYMMYKTLAEYRWHGGLAIKYAYIMEMNEAYEPLLTYKVNIQHNNREQIKVQAGVSLDTSDVFPQYILDFPIINFQGGAFPMKGNTSLENPSQLEFGLDVTPLLSYLNEETELVKFFLQVVENDPLEWSFGWVNSFSVFDYTSGVQEIASEEINIPLIGNGITTLDITHQINDLEKPSILNEDIVSYIAGEPYSYQFDATGGHGNYDWNLLWEYNEEIEEITYPIFDGDNISPEDSESGFTAIPLNFEFPFYGKTYDTLYVHVDGIVTFDDMIRPIPYQVDDQFAFRNSPMIALLYNQNLFYEPGQGIYYNHFDDYITIRWNETIYRYNADDLQVDFGLKLFDDGSIYFFYDNMESIESEITWLTGISNGDDLNYIISDFTNQFLSESQVGINYYPQNYINGLTIDDTGYLTAFPEESSRIVDLIVEVTDEYRVSDRSRFQLTDGLGYNYVIHAGDDDQIDQGETVYLDIEIFNKSQIPQTGIYVNVNEDNPLITLTDASEYFGNIEPGGSLLIMDALSFQAANTLPDQYNFSLEVALSSDQGIWNDNLLLTGYAPVMVFLEPILLAGDNGRFDIGETGQIIIQLMNTGHYKSQSIGGSISNDDDPYVSINGIGDLSFGMVDPGEIMKDTITISVSNNAVNGYQAFFDVLLIDTYELVYETSFDLLIGKVPVMIVDLDPNHFSGPVLDALYDTLNIMHNYQNGFVSDLNSYANMFICLGRYYDSFVLSELESDRIIDFIADGGNVYLEGSQTWYTDPQTDAHELFNIDVLPVMWEAINYVYGVNETFAEGMYWDYNADMSFTDYFLVEENSSFCIVNSDENEEKKCIIAFEGENYKTIGSLLLFGDMDNPDTMNQRLMLLEKYNEFFGIETISGVSDHYYVDEPFNATVYPNPATNIINVLISHPGDYDLDLFDLNGIQLIQKQKLWQDNSKQIINKIGVSRLSPGIYLLKIKNRSGDIIIKKMIKI